LRTRAFLFLILKPKPAGRLVFPLHRYAQQDCYPPNRQAFPLCLASESFRFEIRSLAVQLLFNSALNPQSFPLGPFLFSLLAPPFALPQSFFARIKHLIVSEARFWLLIVYSTAKGIVDSACFPFPWTIPPESNGVPLVLKNSGHMFSPKSPPSPRKTAFFFRGTPYQSAVSISPLQPFLRVRRK